MDRHPHFEAPPEPEEESIALDAGHFFADDFGTTAAEQASHEPLDARLARERADDTVEREPGAARPERHLRIDRIDDPGHWNVIATAQPHHEAEAHAVLARLGEIQESPFSSVFLVTVDDVGAFADAMMKVITDEPAVGRSLARLLPAQHTFHYESLADLEAITYQLIDDWTDELEGVTFHVRCHRRGHVNDLDTAEEESFLGDAILRRLSDLGTPGRVSFNDPDVVIDIETLNDEAAISMWTRDDLNTYPFLRIE
jgi:tRNA(Ser,Leu) C12 N-acetylase TAN1